MPSVINSDNGVISGTSGLKTSGSNDGLLDFQSNGTRIAGITTSAFQVGTDNISSVNSLGFRNRIINGDMRIDQRNAGASVTPASNDYTLDRWQAALTQTSKFTIQRNAGSVTPPAGFTNYLGVTSSSAYSVLTSDFFLVRQKIEGFNVADFGWGAAGAQTVTLSFWVRSSLTGTFGGAIYNAAGTRSYPFSYTISAANTWEQKTITIAGDTTGTWATDNGASIQVSFNLGAGSTYSGTAGAWSGSFFTSATGATSVVGTNGATFYITGVQLEAGSVATPFERRAYGTELALCQRYYYKVSADSVNDRFGSGFNYSTTLAFSYVPFQTQMRTAPTALEQSGTASNYNVVVAGSTYTCTAVPVFEQATNSGASVQSTNSAVLVAGQGSMFGAASTSAYLAWSAEL